jgi:hypothetical protein
MRNDMDRVVIERPRRNHSDRYNSYGARARDKNQDFENAPKHEGMEAPHRMYYQGKEFSDLLGPLWGFLRRNVGQKWDDLYSEICAKLPVQGLSGYHIVKQHLRPSVEVNPLYIDGVYYPPYHRQTYSFKDKLSPFNKGEFYVDKDGRLCEGTVSPRWRYRSGPAPLTEIKDGDLLYKKEDGIWYLWSPIPYEDKEAVHGRVYDPNLKDQWSKGWKTEIIGYRTVTKYRWRKKQLNSKELKAIGVQNDKVQIK